MVQFTATLTERDIRQFVSYKMQLKRPRVLLPFAVYAAAMAVALLLTLSGVLGFIGWIVFLILAGLFLFSFVRLYKTYQKTVLDSLEIVGKEREFSVDERLLYIRCPRSAAFSGRYSLYDVRGCTETALAWYLDFTGKDFIIIPKRAMDDQTAERFRNILQKAAGRVYHSEKN